MCLDLHVYLKNENYGEKEEEKNQPNFNAVDDRRLAVDKTRPISIEFGTSLAMHYG